METNNTFHRDPNWFLRVFNCHELDFQQNRNLIQVAPSEENRSSTDETNPPPIHLLTQTGKRVCAGRFEIQSVKTLRDILQPTRILAKGDGEEEEEISMIFSTSGDGCEELILKDADESVFQVASQFNCLEMISPDVQPSAGITNYWKDRTQGPACSMACPVGTLYRKYFYTFHREHTQFQEGQLDNHQVNTMQNVLHLCNFNSIGGMDTHGEQKFLDTNSNTTVKFKNGYLLGIEGMNVIGQKMNDPFFKEQCIDAFQVGIQSDTQVWMNAHHHVHQVFCSALPLNYMVNYTSQPYTVQENVGEFAKMVLRANYEATILAAETLRRRSGQTRKRVVLTLVGGGVFGNKIPWIAQVMSEVLTKYKHFPLNVELNLYKYHHVGIHAKPEDKQSLLDIKCGHKTNIFRFF